MTDLPLSSFSALTEIHWNDTNSIVEGSVPIFTALAEDPELLGRLLANLLTDQDLRAMCERYDFLDKLVLDDDKATQVRL